MVGLNNPVNSSLKIYWYIDSQLGITTLGLDSLLTQDFYHYHALSRIHQLHMYGDPLLVHLSPQSGSVPSLALAFVLFKELKHSRIA